MKYALRGQSGKPTDDVPLGRSIDREGDGVRLVSVDVHEDRGAIEVGMFAVNLRERAREIVGKDAIADAHGSLGAGGIHAP